MSSIPINVQTIDFFKDHVEDGLATLAGALAHAGDVQGLHALAQAGEVSPESPDAIKLAGFCLAHMDPERKHGFQEEWIKYCGIDAHNVAGLLFYATSKPPLHPGIQELLNKFGGSGQLLTQSKEILNIAIAENLPLLASIAATYQLKHCPGKEPMAGNWCAREVASNNYGQASKDTQVFFAIYDACKNHGMNPGEHVSTYWTEECTGSGCEISGGDVFVLPDLVVRGELSDDCVKALWTNAVWTFSGKDDVTIADATMTLLLCALEDSEGVHFDVCQVIESIGRKMDINATHSHGRMPLAQALAYGSPRIISGMQDAGLSLRELDQAMNQAASLPPILGLENRLNNNILFAQALIAQRSVEDFSSASGKVRPLP